ncbi:DUF3667 domain-containing protein [Flavobacterium sp. K5-23]|uniref:DUF3667 domain-containing protein n=1 Tax=Flavobacterium sp. K5-23 TaxID=2746225 RepID=UPI00200DA098|nr:DUF3667 domain-containing protein [Flavobacterium sp. K5-23]UQD56651.1 DUF3667 domain-containing protein [Flavobacterium sp. K5-23]
MNHKQCLNCEQTVSGNYCQNCGQKNNTHAITLKHFLFHDIIHGVWHLEKGILLTIKETFTRPGQAALDYINGKRVKYYNVFYLILMLIGLNVLTVHYHHKIDPSSVNKNVGDGLKFMNFLSGNVKVILLGFVPLIALNAFLVFRRLKLNLAEHFIIGGINLLGILVLCLFINLLSLLDTFQGIEYVAGILKFICFFLILLFPIWTYFNATKKRYSILGFTWRILTFYMFTIIEISIILYFIMFIVTNQTTFKLNL